MGIKASVATIYVQFDKGEVESGCQVNGKAYLSVNQQDVSCVSIGCRIRGQESTQVEYTVTVGSGDNQHTERRTAYEKRNFLDIKLCLHSVPSGSISKGQYEFPFTFRMPAEAPASMSLSLASDRCSVSYSMEVWLDRPGMLRWDIRNTRHIIVTRPVPTTSKVPLFMEPNRVDLYSCCCYKRGDILLGGSAETSMLYAGETTSVKYAATNNSTVRIKAMEVFITESINFHARGHHSGSTRNLYHRRMSPEETKLNLTKLVSRNGPEFDYLNELRVLSKLLLESDQTKITFQVPSTARTTYHGSLIRITHLLHVKVCTTFGTANPSLVRELQLFSKAADLSNNASNRESTDIPQLPPDWAPTVAEVVQLPSPHVSKTSHADDDDDDDKPVRYASTSEPDIPGKYNSCAELIQAMSKTYDPCGELEKYFYQGNNADEIEPDELYMMFKEINDTFDQQRFADILAAKMTSITCAKLARSAAGARDMCKREVVEKLLAAGQVMDKENAHLVKSELSAFQFMTVERFFE